MKYENGVNTIVELFIIEMLFLLTLLFSLALSRASVDPIFNVIHDELSTFELFSCSF